MHHARAVVLLCCGLAGAAACMRTTYPDEEKVSVVETTGAPVTVVGDGEPDTGLDELAARFVGQICAREVQCHDDPSLADSCIHTYLGRSRSELARWRCSPAAADARAKECLSAIREEPCIVNLASRSRLCESNVACPDPDARLIPPGRALADAGL